MLVFAKAPVPGEVKTRLSPAVGATVAAQIYRCLLQRTLEQACAANVGPVSLIATPDCTHPELRALASRYGLRTGIQRGANLGERMFNALSDGLDHSGKCLLLGSDCINLTAADVVEAAIALEHDKDAVLAPSGDGGYVALGTQRVDWRLFKDIRWSTSVVAAQTRDAILALGWQLHELRVLRDLDNPCDLALIPRAWWLP